MDESKLDWRDRIALGYLRLNGWHWDDIFGPKPEGFDGLKNYIPFTSDEKKRKEITKSTYIDPIMKVIDSNIDAMTLSRAHFIYGMLRTEEEWRTWYFGERIKNFECRNKQNNKNLIVRKIVISVLGFLLGTFIFFLLRS